MTRRLLASICAWLAGPQGSHHNGTAIGTSLASDPLGDQYRFSGEILDKKYQLYVWCETKVYNLVTINGALLAALSVILYSNMGSNARYKSLLFASGFASIGLLSLSVLICLIHIIPKMNSGRTDGKNIRSVIGTNKFTNGAEYHDALASYDLDAMIRSNCDQIVGMNTNIWKNHMAIRRAARSTIAGLVMFSIFASIALIGSPKPAATDAGRTPDSTTSTSSVTTTTGHSPATSTTISPPPRVSSPPTVSVPQP